MTIPEFIAKWRKVWQEDRRWRRVTTNGLPSAAQRLNTPP